MRLNISIWNMDENGKQNANHNFQTINSHTHTPQKLKEKSHYFFNNKINVSKNCQTFELIQ